jgi:hypothetical protein
VGQGEGPEFKPQDHKKQQQQQKQTTKMYLSVFFFPTVKYLKQLTDINEIVFE